jgi:GrpB-like predicted nucleotidyltransferase (UPF0157 family)
MSGGGDSISPEERAEPVEVVPYDRHWPETFAALRDRLAVGVGELAVGIEHVGSTAVPGLAAKPIVDIDLVIRNAGDFTLTAERLTGLGYVHLGDLGIVGREAFRAPAHLPRHHLFVCASGTPALQAHLTLRDALRADRALADAYAQLKRDLAAAFRDDRDSYTEGKTAFIRTVLLDVRDARRRSQRS